MSDSSSNNTSRYNVRNPQCTCSNRKRYCLKSWFKMRSYTPYPAIVETKRGALVPGSVGGGGLKATSQREERGSERRGGLIRFCTIVHLHDSVISTLWRRPPYYF